MTSTLSGLEIFAGSSYRGSICPTVAKIGSSYREFREIGDEIIEHECHKINGNKVWFEISGGSGIQGLEKSGFHCIHVPQLVVETFYSKWCDHEQKFANILMLMIFAVFVQPLKRISY